MSSLFTLIPWFLASIVIGAVNIMSAIYLLEQRHKGPMLMLAGSGIALLGQLGNQVLQFFMMQSGHMATYVSWILPISCLSALGTLLFSIGLLLHALHQRGKANRIAELEAILNSRMG